VADHKQDSGSGIPYPIKIVIGIVFIALGYFLSKTEIKIAIIEYNPGITVAMIGVLLIMFPLVQIFFTKPLGDAIRERNANLERTFTEAEQLRADMTTLRADYERRLAETEASAREQIQNQIKEAQNLRQSLMTEAADKADELVKKAQQEIEAERDRLINDIRVHVVDLTLAATEKMIGANMDSDKNRKLVADFIQDLEVAK